LYINSLKTFYLQHFDINSEKIVRVIPTISILTTFAKNYTYDTFG